MNESAAEFQFRMLAERELDGRMKQFDQLMLFYRHSPLVHAHLTQFLKGESASWEECLVGLVVALATENERFTRAAQRLAMLQTATPVTVENKEVTP